jgi:hypothetical protein
MYSHTHTRDSKNIKNEVLICVFNSPYILSLTNAYVKLSHKKNT